MERITPWLKSDGTSKSEEEIKRSCKNWGPSVWEDYLKTFEVEQKEILLKNPSCIEKYSQEEIDIQKQNVLSEREFPIFKKYLFEAVKELTFKQRVVLSQIFLEGQILRVVGENMEISTYAVARIRDRALRRLGLVLIKRMTEVASKTPRRDFASQIKNQNPEYHSYQNAL